MKKNFINILIAILLVISITACSEISYPENLAVKPGSVAGKTFTEYEDLNIQPVAASLSEDYMRGVDASEVKALEECGLKFYDSDNTEKDVFEIFANHGVNWVRLRIWNDYTVAMDPAYGALGDSYFAPYGWNNLSRTINMAKRAKVNGLKVLLDFHYSDTWTDPAKQFLPKMWQEYKENSEALAVAVADYTKEIIVAMKEADCAPDMIQLGNESEGGLFKKDYLGNELSFNHDQISACLVAAAKVVREELPECEIMLHMSAGGDTGRLSNFFTNYVNKMVDGDTKLCDAVGLSYYPFYSSHKTLDNLVINCETIKEKGYKPVIAEISYCYNKDAYTDNLGNIFYNQSDVAGTNIPSLADKEGKIEGTIENQALVVREVLEKTAAAGSTGIFYWGTCYLGVDDIMASAYENQALFDAQGKVLPSMDVFAVKGTN
ncbi:MAG: glycosyl hydrolase 53 family protein [Spirochaetaceae bacterium]|nr:glycosyl hydrolase 53 family protein [Spirochaetaceae bacterium]